MSRTKPPLAKLPFYYGWIVIAVAFVTMAIAVNARTAFSLLFPAILEEFHWDRGVIAGAFSIGFVASGLFTPLMGYVMDRWGPRAVIPFGAVMVIGGLLGATTVSSPFGFYVYLGFLVMTGTVAMTYFAHSMFLPHWFVRKRGLAIGIAFSGAGIGSITLLPWFQNIIDNSGWREACIVIASVVAIIIPLAYYFQRQTPQEIGLEPDGDAGEEDVNNIQRPDPIVDQAWANTEWTLALAARTSRFWWIFFAYFSALYAWYSVLVHQTVYLVETGFDSTTAATALGLVGLFGIAGQIGLGALSDRIGREWTWTLSLSGYFVCYGALLALPGTSSNFLLYLMVVMQGLLGFGLAALYGSVSAEVFAGRRFASIFAVCGLGGNLGAGVGPWLTGYLFDTMGNYQVAFQLCMVMSVISIFCMWMAGPRKIRLVAGQAARRAAKG
jgi:sugar phosphate permease